jgi:hypothetical protein
MLQICGRSGSKRPDFSISSTISVGNEAEDDLPGCRGVGGAEHGDSVCLEGGDGPLHAVVVGGGGESASNRSIEVWVDLGRH